MSMPDQPDAGLTGAGHPSPDRWNRQIDLRDALGVGGAAVVLIGAAAFHWGLALMLVGLLMIAGAFYLAKR